MKIYQLSFAGDPDGHKGYSYFASRRAAEDEKRDWERDSLERDATITEIEIEPTKHGIIRALNIHGGHPDNG